MTNAIAAASRTALSATLALFLLLVAPARADELTKQLFDALGSSAHQTRDDEVLRFYTLRDFRPAWDDRSAALAQDALKHADAEGLDPRAYRLGTDERPADDADAARWEIALTTAFLRYARDVRTGLVDPRDVYDDVSLPREEFDAPAQLNTALKGRDLAKLIAALPPPRAEYRALRAALARYRTGGSQGAAIPQTADVSALPPATQKRLWNRLAGEDDKLGAWPDADQAGALDDALRAYQTRHGLDADGRIGPQTSAALNATMSSPQRVAQIEANMERWRWMPRRIDKRYLEVNAADASLTVVDHGDVMLISNVIVGRRNWKTPLLATKVEAVILNPAWPIPMDMVRAELLPKLMHNASYLAQNDMVLANGPPDDPHGVNVNWRTVSRHPFPYAISQAPGENNALGSFLLDMPNRFEVYLHDTPAQALFAKQDRYFSHGCVRVERISEVASFALYGDPNRPIDARADLARTESLRLPLAEPLPVYFVYWTAIPSADGAIDFKSDVYGRDAQLNAALGIAAPHQKKVGAPHRQKKTGKKTT